LLAVLLEVWIVGSADISADYYQRRWEEFSLLQTVQMASGTHPASYSVSKAGGA